ncbi:MAG: NAD(P)/FAD-dependent oxidoreductase [Deltaproteobacteria bacterium]|nr:NAD(P)/FAD-dependent oxidoreductase [Deltaproteobacteria bacterium]
MNGGPTQQHLQKTYDCVVVGAGNGGLAAAAQLAVKGADVLLLERHTLPGGFATSFTRGRFEFEASLHQFCDVGSPTDKGNVREFLEDELGVYLDWVEIPEAFRMILTDPGEDLDVTLPYGVQDFIEAVEKAVPGSRESVTKYVDLCREVVEAITYLGQSKGNPDKSVLTKKYANFLKTCAYTADQVIEALGVPERARKILHAQWSYIGPPTSRLNFTIYGAMLYKFLETSAYIPRQRSHEFSLALDARIRKMGGHIEYNTRVEEILTRNGRVVGVVTSKGDRIETGHVISNASPTLVYNHLISPRTEVPEKALRACNARVNGVSAMVVYLGLDASLEELGINEYSYFVYANMNTTEMYETFKALEAPKVQAVLCLNNAIPDCSPPGTSIVSTTTLYQPDVWKHVSPRDYVKVKNRIANDLIVDLERALGAPLREHIEEIEVATPQTYARYTGSFNGIIYGYEPEPWDSLIPRMMMMGDDKHFDGLEFCGGFAFRCHGYSSAFMSGQTAALLTLRDLIEAGKAVQ